MWRAFVQSALVPLVLVEVVLIAVYLLTNTAIRDAQLEHLREVALLNMRSAVQSEARNLDQQLQQVAELTRVYANLTQRALSQPVSSPANNLSLHPSGVRYSPHNAGGAASFYSSVTQAERQNLRKVAQLQSLDGLMAEITQQNPLVTSVYFNSWDSYNHIYPWFMTPEQYPLDMQIPEYNFYYLADAKHNPERRELWTDVYLDPAGQGWMMSSIAPVYKNDFLEGVVGLDITINSLLEQSANLQVPWSGYAMLVSGDMNIMAMPERGEQDFDLRELTSHSYEQAIRQELFKPEDFNLDGRVQTADLAAAMREQDQGVLAVELGGERRLVAWRRVEQSDWRLLLVTDEEQVYASTTALSEHFWRIGLLLIAGLVVFYVLFFALMWWRAKQLSERLIAPIHGISARMQAIGEGRLQHTPVPTEIRELAQIAEETQRLGQTLADSEERQQTIQKRLELVLESTTESLWERDIKTGSLSLRGRFRERFGLPEGELAEALFVARIHPDDLPRVRLARERVEQAEQDTYQSEFRFADAQGRYHWLLSRGRVLARDPQTGRVTALAGTHVDIDELKQTEADLRQATLEAQLASQAKSRFISSISHELRTPLNAIHGLTQLMIMERGTPAETRSDHLDEILLASRHLDQLVGDLLDWSGMQAEKPKLQLQPVAVAGLMQECADLVAVEVRVQDLTLNVDLPESEVQVAADPRRLRQVLLNLLSNAIKYNKPQGHITLSYQIAAGFIRIMVEDTGLGVEPELQSQLFEPFQRLGRENTCIQGAGIGLSLCRDLASLMNGHMAMSSQPGIGSSFWIELPLWQGEQMLSSEQQAAELLPRVVYVEDNPASQFLIRKALADVAQVEVISDGLSALQRLLDEPPALLLLDLNLPGSDGELILRRLREQPQTRHLPVLILSAVADQRRLSSLESQGVLSKPVDLRRLRALVLSLLEQPRNASID